MFPPCRSIGLFFFISYVGCENIDYINFKQRNNFWVLVKILIDFPIIYPSIILIDSAYKGIQSHFVVIFSWVETLVLVLPFQIVSVFFRHCCLILVVHSHGQPNSCVFTNTHINQPNTSTYSEEDSQWKSHWLALDRMTYKIMIRSTPFRMAFVLEVVMLVEFQIPIWRVQVTKWLDEELLEQIRKEQLLNLEESQLQAMWHSLIRRSKNREKRRHLLIDTGRVVRNYLRLVNRY